MMTISLDNSAAAQLQVATRPAPGPEARWFAIQTRPRHEKKIAGQLGDSEITTFVPCVAQVHQWSDRRKQVDVPLFSCYVFLRVAEWRQAYERVLRVPGVFQWVRNREEPSAISNAEIESIRTVLAQGLPVAPYPYLKIGQRVRLRRGCLAGIEGILVECRNSRKLVVSVDLIQQSLAVSVDGYDLEAA